MESSITGTGNSIPSLTEDDNTLKNYFYNDQKKNWNGTQVVEFVADEFGYTTDIKMLKEFNKDATVQTALALSNLRWKSGHKNNQPARYRTTIAIHYGPAFQHSPISTS